MLKVDDVSINIDGLDILKNVSIEAKDNEITALIGPNGAGKTTLFNMISGIYTPNSGRIYFNDVDITGLKPYEINKIGIARTFQVVKLFSKMSVLDNVLVGMHTKIETNFIDDIFHMKNKEEKMAHKNALSLLKSFDLEHVKDVKAGSLSYGQQRLLEIARALGSEPKFLLLDEPAAGMNDTEKKDLCDKIKQITKKGTSVIIVEHDMSLVMNIADKIFVIDSARNLSSGTPEEIQKDQKVIKAYLGED